MMFECAYSVGCCLSMGKHEGKMSWEHLNELWHDRFAPDRRYKLWFCATDGDTYIMRVGNSKILVRFIDGVAYSRTIHGDIFKEQPCFACHKIVYKCKDGRDIVGFEMEYQRDVLI